MFSGRTIYVLRSLHLLGQSAFNRRLRRLWGAFIVLQDAVATELVTAQDYEVMDGYPIPVALPLPLFAQIDILSCLRYKPRQNSRYSILKFFQVDNTGMRRITSSARYFKEGVGSRRPN